MRQNQREKCKAASVSSCIFEVTEQGHLLTGRPPQKYISGAKKWVQQVLKSTCTQVCPVFATPECFQASFWTKTKSAQGSFSVFLHCISAETVTFAYSPFFNYISELCEAKHFSFGAKV